MSEKALFVMDMPEKCVDCVFCFEIDEGTEACCTVTDEQGHKGLLREIKEDYCQCKPDWCPLKPVPGRRKGTDYLDAIFQHPAFDYGWNACIDKILEGCKDETD